MNAKVLKIKETRSKLKELTEQVDRGLLTLEEYVEQFTKLDQQLDEAIDAALKE